MKKYGKFLSYVLWCARWMQLNFWLSGLYITGYWHTTHSIHGQQTAVTLGNSRHCRSPHPQSRPLSTVNRLNCSSTIWCKLHCFLNSLRELRTHSKTERVFNTVSRDMVTATSYAHKFPHSWSGFNKASILHVSNPFYQEVSSYTVWHWHYIALLSH